MDYKVYKKANNIRESMNELLTILTFLEADNVSFPKIILGQYSVRDGYIDPDSKNEFKKITIDLINKRVKELSEEFDKL